MKIIDTELPEVKILEPRVFGDDRGFFLESYNAKVLEELLGIKDHFIQDNHSYSAQNVLRGLHYQVTDPQGKLVRAVSGEIYDVAIDIRPDSPNYKKWTAAYLSSENKRMLWVPPGFAHGFLVVSKTADVLYKVTQFYNPAADRSIRWDDPSLQIAWPLQGEPQLSPKDAAAPLL